MKKTSGVPGVDSSIPLFKRRFKVNFDFEKPALNIGSGNKYLVDFINLEKFKESHHHRGKTVEPDVYGDAHKLPFKDKSFNTVYMRHLLEHLEVPLMSLAEAHRVLKKGGIIRVEVPDGNRVHIERDEHLYSWTEWTLKNIIKYVGFKIKRYWKCGKVNHGIEGIK